MIISLWCVFILFSVSLPKVSKSSQMLPETMFRKEEGKRCDVQDPWDVRDEQNVRDEQDMQDGMCRMSWINYTAKIRLILPNAFISISVLNSKYPLTFICGPLILGLR